MRFRTLALALALSCGATSLVQAAPKKASVKRPKKLKKIKKIKPDKRFKQSKAAKVKPRKARKVKHA
jgi:hypothetical protein